MKSFRTLLSLIAAVLGVLILTTRTVSADSAPTDPTPIDQCQADPDPGPIAG